MAALTLLQLVQEFSRRRGLPVPSQVVGSQDDTTQQIWGLCNEGITEIVDRYEWQFTRVRYTFAHAGSTNYIALDLSDTGPIPDYKAMLNRTLWDGLARREVIGPLAPKEWEVLLNLNISQAVYQYTIMGNALRIYPQPAVLTANQFRMEYISKYGVYDPIQAANTEFYEADTSVCLFPSSLMLADLKWRWGMTKGLPYAEDLRMFEGMVANLQGRDPAPDIMMDADRFTQVAAPGLLVAAGELESAVRAALLDNTLKARAATSQSANVPAPTGGWNTRDSLAEMPPLDAYILDNLFPRYGQCVLRGGSASAATGMTGTVKSLAQYAPASGTRKLFAVTDAGIYDITAGGVVSGVAQALTNGYWNSINIANSAGTAYLWGCNGTDTPKMWDGATWATPAITGIATPANLVYPILFKHRIFAIEKNTLKAWYLPLDSIQGVASPLPYGNLMRNGGSLQSLTSWTLDAGDGSDDLFAAISTEGDLVIYQGIDPSSASSWQLVGVWAVGKPVGRRCFQKAAGDVVLITENGVFPLSKLLKSGTVNFATALSNKIQPSFTSMVQSVGIATEGWEATVYPQYDALIINVPPGPSTAGQQFVMSTVTGSWCSFSGWRALCFQVYEGHLYFGTTGGIVKAAWGTLVSDGGTDIIGTGYQAYNYFGTRTQLKQVKVFRPLLSYDGTVQQTWGISPDYADIRLSSTVSRGSSAVGTAWDAGAWDTFAWAGNVAAAKLWKAASHAPGFALSLRLQLTSNNGSVSWFGTDYILQSGGMM